MSRVGRKPIAVPEKVKVEVRGRHAHVEGPLGKLDALLPPGVTLAVNQGILTVSEPEENRRNRGYQGMGRAILANMVRGVVHGYERSLEISGVGYKAELKGDTLVFSLGYTHLIHLKLPTTIKAVLDKSQTKLTIKGIDKQLVGQIAAQIYGYKKPEPYKGKGVNYAGRPIRRKVGKAGAK
jgi:large subunit ribosomal protein L6